MGQNPPGHHDPTFSNMATAIPGRAMSERDVPFQTISRRPVERLYTRDATPNFDYARELNDPGAYPYTRGIHPTGYRGKLWTMRQFAGFGSAFGCFARNVFTSAWAAVRALSSAFRNPKAHGSH